MNSLRKFISRLCKSEHVSVTNVQNNNNIEVNVIKENNALHNDRNDVAAKETNFHNSDNNLKEVVKEETSFIQIIDNKLDSTVNSTLCSNNHENNYSEDTKECKSIKMLNKLETSACNNFNNSIHNAKVVRNNNEIMSNVHKQWIPNENYTKLNVIKGGSESESGQHLTDAQWHCSLHENIIDVNVDDEHIQDGMFNYQTIDAILSDSVKMLEETNKVLINNTNVTSVPKETCKERHSNLNDLLELPCVDDQTLKCMKEFNKVLATVQKNNDSDDTHVYPAEEIDHILLDENLDIDNDLDHLFDDDSNMESTYNFQEIKYINLEDTTFMTHDNIDVISISSDDTSTIVENNSKAINDNTTNYSTKEIINIKNNKTPIHVRKIVVKRSIETKIYKVTKTFINNENTNKSRIVQANDSCKETTSLEINNYKGTKITEPKILEETKSTVGTKHSNAFLDIVPTSADGHLDTVPSNLDKIESDNCGYHSSDFEFITEEEATKNGIIYNVDHQRQLRSKEQTRRIQANTKRKRSKTKSHSNGPGPSRSRHYSRSKVPKKVTFDESSKETYVVPQDDEVVNMFHNVPLVAPPQALYLENKSLHTRAPALSYYEGVGFDVCPAMQRDNEDDNHRDAARGSLDKILEMYPAENSRRGFRKRVRR